MYHRDRAHILRQLAEAQRTLLDLEARGDRMPRHEIRERMMDALDLLTEAMSAQRAVIALHARDVFNP